MFRKKIPAFYLIGVSLFWMSLFSVWMVFATNGPLDAPEPPNATLSYTLTDIYNRLDSGMVGTQSTFSEPPAGPITSTGYTLNEIMATAPKVDDVAGANASDVVANKTVWGLTSGQWGLVTGTMSDNGAVIITPTTTNQPIPAGYHNGSGYIPGDTDLTPNNIVNNVEIFGITGTYTGGGSIPTTTLALVAQTGQTITYQTGDDGDLQTGLAWPIPRFTNNFDGTITDNLTGLVWLEEAYCFGAQTWTNAISLTASLAAGQCGLTDGSTAGDWRLPNIRELLSLIYYGETSLSIASLPPGHPFNNVQTGFYWSSTTYDNSTNNAWLIQMVSGNSGQLGKTSSQAVWAVRND